MPWQAAVLARRPEPLPACPLCDAEPFESFTRGAVQRNKYPWWKRPFSAFLTEKDVRPYCAIICSSCGEIVGHESLAGAIELTRSTMRILVLMGGEE